MLLWLPGWSLGPSAWPPPSLPVPAGAHRSVSFAACAHAHELLETARAALEKQAEPVGVVGWSLGAMVALELARDEPERVRALYLLGATRRFVDPAGETGGWPERVLQRMSARLEDDPGGALEAFDRRMFSPAERQAGHDRRWLEVRDGAVPPVASLRAGLDYLCRFSVEPAAVRVPVFLLHGSEDAICPPAQGQALAARLPHGHLTMWAGAGHAPFFTAPERFRDWLHACVRT